MSEALALIDPTPPAPSRARLALIKRLADVSDPKQFTKTLGAIL